LPPFIRDTGNEGIYADSYQEEAVITCILYGGVFAELT
jgi:hypothetical protein